MTSLSPNKLKTTNGMSDIIRHDLFSEKTKFRKHVQTKIDKLDEKMVFTNYKFQEVQYWFKFYNLFIIFLATFLTLTEAMITGFDITQLVRNDTLKNVIEFTPLILSSMISFTGAVVKFNEYEESIEEITRASEKGHAAMIKLKEICEELHFCYRVEKFSEIHIRYTNDIYSVYLDCINALDRQLSSDDIDKFTKLYAKSDVKKLKIIIDREEKIKNFGNNVIIDNQNPNRPRRNFLFPRGVNIMNFFGNRRNQYASQNYSPPTYQSVELNNFNSRSPYPNNEFNCNHYTSRTKLNKSKINGRNICLRSETNRNMLPHALRNLSPNPSRAISPDTISLDENDKISPNTSPLNIQFKNCPKCNELLDFDAKICINCNYLLVSENNSSNGSSGTNNISLNLSLVREKLNKHNRHSNQTDNSDHNSDHNSENDNSFNNNALFIQNRWKFLKLRKFNKQFLS